MVEPIPLHAADQPIPMPSDVDRSSRSGPGVAEDEAKVIRGRFQRRRRTGLPTTPHRPTAQERAFLPAALELVETPASPALRWTAFILCTLIAGALAWSWWAHIDMVAVASGKVVPLGQVKVVQPLETAMIRAIHVEEGDHVDSGQSLVDLDPTEAQADLGTLTYNRAQAALDAEVARMLMTRDPREPFQAPPGIDLVLAEQNHAQADREIERHLATIAGLEADKAQKLAALEANAAQIERGRGLLPILEERHGVLNGLYEKQYGARPPVLEVQQQIVEKRADMKAAQGARRQIEAELRSLDAKVAETKAGFIADATDRRTKALQKISGLDQEITKARQKESYRRLIAPVAGTVQGIKVHTPGAVVTTADVLMTVVPDGSGIEIDASVLNGDIGFVAEGQEVEVKLDAFPFTRYGLVRGRVRKLGRDASYVPSNGMAYPPGGTPAANDLAYPAKVLLDRDWIGVDGRREKIRPGMRVSAEIRTGERRVLEYLLSPVVRTVSEAGRER